MYRRLIVALPLLLPVGVAAQAPSVAERAAATITEADFRSRVEVLAHDSMRGRNTPSPELEQTARWIADEFRRFGLRPGGDDGGYLQRYLLQRTSPDFEASDILGADLRFGRDVLFFYGLPPEGDFNGPTVVISGSGDPAAAISADEVRGRNVVLVTTPPELGARSPAAIQVLRTIFAMDPASLIVATTRGDEEWEAELSRQRAMSRFSVGGSGSGLPMAILEVRDRALAPVLAARGIELSSLRARAGEGLRVDPVPGLDLTIRPRTRILEEESAPNVVGILPGSDPELADEYVVYSAHMDHVGVGNPDASGDSIYNGADDDASGTAAVIELAEAFAALEEAPRRSMIFVLVSGEEKGLWGSNYFVENPPVPVEGMVANVNADMVGRNWPDTIVAIGREHSDLGETLARVNERHPELGMTAIDDLWPEENFYRRSDHYNFARKGVPILFFFNGTHEDYHRPSDEPESIDAEKAARLSQLLFYLGFEIAQADEAPRWNPQSYREIVGEAGGR